MQSERADMERAQLDQEGTRTLPPKEVQVLAFAAVGGLAWVLDQACHITGSSLEAWIAFPNGYFWRVLCGRGSCWIGLFIHLVYLYEVSLPSTTCSTLFWLHPSCFSCSATLASTWIFPSECCIVAHVTALLSGLGPGWVIESRVITRPLESLGPKGCA